MEYNPVYYEARPKKHENKEAISEYQAVFKKWPWQPPRESLAPYAFRFQHDMKTKFSDVTTYRNDFLGLKLKKKIKKPGINHDLEDKQTQTEVRSGCNSTYSLEYYPKSVERSRPCTPCQSHINSITSGPDQSRPLSSYQAVYKLPTVDKSDKEKEKEQKKEDKEEIKKKEEEVETKPEPKEESQKGKKTTKDESEYISTAMADYRRHENFERRKPCYPVINDHFIHDKFESQTSYAITYKPHDITIPEKPLWGRKPVYKHPQGGMILESRYMKDYTDPKVIHPVALIKPQAGMKSISGDGDVQMQPFTTYSLNYQEWKNARPAALCPQDFKLYEPPTEKMICESTQKEHFRDGNGD
ncbi:hypothetical protein ACJMK2_005717 [Sinanodonta woodiana]|uniref:Uncharacterized protein n=1 Tax=Sinanodonta woodiana TaxID=1069815 RepID=A0ABD3VQZ6_SINWO